MTTELTVHIADNSLAGPTLAAIDELISHLSAAEQGLEHGYAKLGFLLTEVSEKNYWRGQYQSFGEYIAELSTKYNRGRSQLYNYLGTVRELKEHVTEAQLTEMGIAKAGELRKAVKASGIAPSQEIIEQATDPKTTVKDVRKLLFDAKQLPEQESDSVWLDLDAAFYVTPDEKLVFDSAMRAADRTDPVIQTTLKHSARMKERLLRWAMEYLNSHPEEE